MSRTVGFYGGKFSPLHLGHVYAMTVASCMVDELHVVVCYDEEWEKEAHTPENSKVPYVHHDQRARWIKEIAKDMPNVKVHVAYNKQTMLINDWIDGAKEIKNVIGRENKITHVFSSESHYGEFFEQLYDNAEHVIIDEERSHYPISASYLRRHGLYHVDTWEMIPKVVQKSFVKKVLVVGVESCGKTTLAKHLARIFSTEYVEETGRTFYDDVNDYDNFFLEDYIEFTHYQKHLEYQFKKRANKVMFTDTDALVTLRFSRHHNNTDMDFLKAVAKTQHYDLVIYLPPDVDFVEDGTRMSAKNREESDEMLRGILDEFEINYYVVGGSYLDRLKQSELLVDKLMRGKL